MTAEGRRMSAADRAGLAARSPEGHAARSMSIKGQEEVWIRIQANTFCNWLNVSLADTGLSPITDLETDLKSGVTLVTLVEKLQKRKIRHNKKPINQHQELENISIALDAIQDDGIKLVNIGNTDIHHGNLKLILGLIWSLIAHYQLGASNFPPKKLILAWLRAILPECNIKNFTSDWNNGIYLSALIDYCKPGLMSNWKRLNPHNGLENCQRAMELAERHFNIPMVLAPAYMASPNLDELSGMTYFSYFLKEEDSPGYYATLNWVKKQLPHMRVNNFRTDWNDGLAAAALVKTKGGPVPGFSRMENTPEHYISNLEVALNGGKKLGVTPVMEARDMANPNVEYLGMMSWASQFQWIPDKTPPGDRLEVKCNTLKTKVGEECNFKVNILGDDVQAENLNAEVIGPSGPLYVDWDFTPGSGGTAYFQPSEVGMHKVLVTHEGEAVRGTPHFTRVMPSSKKDYDGIEPCAVESTVEVLINPHHAARPELLQVTAYSPSKRTLGCPVTEDNGTFFASFQPDEAGEWKIHVTYNNEDIENSPFKCMVFNPRAIHIPDQDAARRARPGDPFTFTVDASKTGWGEVGIDVTFENESIRRTFYVEEVAHRIYRVTFTPQARGKHKVYVYLHGMEVKGSPFSLKIGKDLKEKSKPSSELFRADKRVSRYKTFEEQRSEERNHYFIEKEIPIQKGPSAPPRTKRDKNKSVKDFKSESRHQTTALFDSEHRTDDGMDLLPVKRKIEFDCPLLVEDDTHIKKHDISVDIRDPEDKKCYSSVRMNDNRSFTSDFTTTKVGKHDIKITISGKELNCTPNFYTYDASKISIQDIPPGYVGSPVEFEIDGTGAGYGNLEIVVNGGRVTSHVSKKSNSKYTASFIPHDVGRHRLDITFNGEKIPHHTWFVEVKDSNAKLLSPGLLTGKSQSEDTQHLYATVNKVNTEESRLSSSDFNKLKVISDTRTSVTSGGPTGYVPLRASPIRTLERNENASERLSTVSKSVINKNYSTEYVNNLLNGNKAKSPERTNGTENNNNNNTYNTLLNRKENSLKTEKREFGEYSHLSAPSLLTKNVPIKTEEIYSYSSKTTNNQHKINSESPNHLNIINNNNNVMNTKTLETTKNPPLGITPVKSSYINESSKTNNSASTSNNVSSVVKSMTTTHHQVSSSAERQRGSSPPPKTMYSTTISKMIKNKGPDVEISALLNSPKEVSLKLSNVNSTDGNVKSSATIKDMDSKTSRTTSSQSTSPNRIPRKVSLPKIVEPISSSLLETKTSKTQSYSTSSYSYSTTRKGEKTITTTTTSSSSTNKDGKPEDKALGSLAAPSGTQSPRLNTFRGMADKCSFEEDALKHFKAGKPASFSLKAPGYKKEDIGVSIISPERRPNIPSKVVDEGNGKFRVEFTTVEVGTYAVDVSASGLNVPGSPFLAKAYDSSLIKVTDITDGVKGSLSTFWVDASKAGDGQLEISINDGEVSNSVQLLEGGKCLVTFTPTQSITHEIEVKFNDEQVPGSPFLSRVTDISETMKYEVNDSGFSRVSVKLDHLSLIPISSPSQFTIHVADGDDAELAVSVQGPSDDIPVKVTGGVKVGFTAEFVPQEVGIHLILVEYNEIAVGGTPFYAKAYDASSVDVSEIPKTTPGKTVTFAVDASEAGDGNLEIFVQSRKNFRDNYEAGYSLKTHVVPLGDAHFSVSFLPEDSDDHIVCITFNDHNVPGSPFVSKLSDNTRNNLTNNSMSNGYPPRRAHPRF